MPNTPSPIPLDVARQNVELKNLLADVYTGLEQLQQLSSFLLGYLDDSGLITQDMKDRNFAGLNPEDIP